jgi:phosphoenolpyruvate synthase/pyruvate phosphate dikinase
VKKFIFFTTSSDCRSRLEHIDNLLIAIRGLDYAQYRSQIDRRTSSRSSATAEDLPDASFAGQQETYLNVHGLLPFEVIETELSQLPPTHTQILMNVGNPDEALGLAAIPCDGVSLARLEFIIANQIKVHPLALLNFDRLTDATVKREIAKLTLLYPHKPDFFVDKLAHGVATI